MYISPVNIQSVLEKAMHDMVEQEENAIYNKVKFVVDVNKDELIKALDYDREQYRKGYYDGYAEAEKHINIYAWHDLRKNPEDFPTETGLYLVFAEIPHLIPPYDCEMEVGYTVVTYAEFRDGYHFDGTTCDDLIIAWRYIERFEDDNEFS